MALIYNTLRNNLLALFAWLGVIALVVLLWNLAIAIHDHITISEEMARGAETDAVIRLSYDLRREDMAMYQSLSGETAFIPLDDSATATEAAFLRARTELDGHSGGNHQNAVSILSMMQEGLSVRRDAANAALRDDPAQRAAALRDWRRFLDTAYPDLEEISHAMIAEMGTPSAQTARLTSLRYFALFAFRVQIGNRFAIERALEEGAPGTDRLTLLAEPAAELRGAANLAEDQYIADDSVAADRIAKATRFILTVYLPSEARVLKELQAGEPRTSSRAVWRSASHNAVELLTMAENALSAEAAERLELAESRNHAAIGLWGGAVLLCLLLLASAVHFTLKRIVHPLEYVHARMLQLANDDMGVQITATSRLAEIQAMYDALQVFKENGLRRLRMQTELARLNDRVVATNQAMTEEMEAAARVQAAQLPIPCDLPGARFHALYRPSRMIAGDTYDHVTLPDGRTRLFQIDVSGHGAAAALVSVMSHIAVKNALLQAAPTDGLDTIIARVNGEWKDSLPYFTLLLVEIDPRAGIARVVQAGHPPLLRLPRLGGVEAVGDGGMPVGALPWAEYEEVVCRFNPGDRLILTTDGVTEAADSEGRLFGDDRYLSLLSRHGRAEVKTLFDSLDSALWDWCGTEAFEDDVTVLVLEAKEPVYAH